MGAFNIGDRIEMAMPYGPGRVEVRTGGFIGFGWVNGDAGVITGKDTYSVYWVKLDKDTGKELKISDNWFRPSTKAALPPAPPPAPVLKVETKVVKEMGPKKDLHPCTCAIRLLLMEGCKCGAVSRYVEPHLRAKHGIS